MKVLFLLFVLFLHRAAVKTGFAGIRQEIWAWITVKKNRTTSGSNKRIED